MTMPGFMTIITREHGTIEGACDLEGLEGTIEIYALDHTVEIPRNPGTGLPSGRRIHKDLTVNKQIDKSTPLLYQALCMGDKLPEVEMAWYRMDETGSMEIFYTIRLENAVISRITPWSPYNTDPIGEDYYQLEAVSFAYEKIIWEWTGGIEFEDSWIMPDKPAGG